jgi:hypothetical protein
VDPKTLKPNDRNWRIHNDFQKTALGGVLSEIGWVQDVIVNKRSGNIIDGHLRVDMAVHKGEFVPVVYVDLSPEEEAKVLAALDPLAAMAETDSEALSALLGGIESENDGLMTYLEGLVDVADKTAFGAGDVETPSTINQQMGDKTSQIKAVLYAPQIAIFESAIKATGLKNRGEALITICQRYLDEEARQFDVFTEGEPSQERAQGVDEAADPAGGDGDARRDGEAIRELLRDDPEWRGDREEPAEDGFTGEAAAYLVGLRN